MSHQHNWEDVSFDYVWTYEVAKCSYGSSWTTWAESRVYQKENPGTRDLLNCSYHVDDHKQHADPETIIHQKCECGDYKDQRVDGVLDFNEHQKETETNGKFVKSAK